MEGRTVHGTGVNRTDAPRRLCAMTLHRSFIRSQDTYSVSLGAQVYAACVDGTEPHLAIPTRAQALLLGAKKYLRLKILFRKSFLSGSSIY